MNKFTMTFKHPLSVQSNSPQAEIWRNATPETHPDYFDTTLVCVTAEGRVFRKQPKHYTGVINRRAAGGKWEEVTQLLSRSDSFKAQFMDSLTPANFRGQPRIN